MSVNSLNLAEFYRNLEEVLDLQPGAVKAGDTLARLDAWDSVAVLGFIAMADEEYHAIIPPNRIPGCRTVDDLAGLIREYSR
jgi:acyl carrier protein